MEEIRNGKDVTLNFNSTNEILEYLKKHNMENATSKTTNIESFCTYSWEQTIDALKNGWKESESIKLNSENLKRSSGGSDYSVNYDVTGDFLDVGAYLTGEPECWGEMIERPKAMKRINIVMDLSIPYWIKQEQIENKGAAVIAMIDSLIESGYYVTIRFANRTSGLGLDRLDVNMNFTFTTENGYSRDMIAFFCAHPGVLRRISFAMCEIITGEKDLGGYGSCVEAMHDQDDFFIKAIHKEGKEAWSTMEESKTRVENVITTAMGARINKPRPDQIEMLGM